VTIADLKMIIDELDKLTDGLDPKAPMPLEAHALAKKIGQKKLDLRDLGIMAYASICTYYEAGKPKDPKSGWRPCVWPGTGYATEKASQAESDRLNEWSKSEHKAHPWWGTWEGNGRHFETKLVEVRLCDLAALKEV